MISITKKTHVLPHMDSIMISTITFHQVVTNAMAQTLMPTIIITCIMLICHQITLISSTLHNILLPHQGNSYPINILPPQGSLVPIHPTSYVLLLPTQDYTNLLLIKILVMHLVLPYNDSYTKSNYFFLLL